MSHTLERNLLQEVESAELREKELKKECDFLKFDLQKTSMENSKLKANTQRSGINTALMLSLFRNDLRSLKNVSRNLRHLRKKSAHFFRARCSAMRCVDCVQVGGRDSEERENPGRS